MEVKIKQGNEMLDATIEMVDGVMVVSPKERFKPKDGDVVTIVDGMHIFICKEDLGGYDIYAYIGYDFEYNRVFDKGVWSVCRFATEEEKKKLFDKLKEEGYEWKQDTKELVKLKWKPKAGQWYYIPVICNAQFKAVIEDWSDDAFDVLYFGKGWAFENKEECQEFCNRLNDAINSVKP